MPDYRTRVTEVAAERMADARVIAELRTDRAYLNAESAEAQSARENEIEAEVWADIESTYHVS